MLQSLSCDDFYILCPDNDVTREMDNARMTWAMQDLTQNRPPLSRWHPDYADVREDRVVLYGMAENSAHLFVYKIKATNAGTYAIPPTFAEGMYDRGVQARALGGKVVVEKK